MQGTDAIAFRAAAALDGYEEQLLALCGNGADPARIAAMQLELRRLCTCCLVLPQLSGPALTLLLAHHSLLTELSRADADADARDAAPGSLPAVEQSLRMLRSRCRELLVAPNLH